MPGGARRRAGSFTPTLALRAGRGKGLPRRGPSARGLVPSGREGEGRVGVVAGNRPCRRSDRRGSRLPPGRAPDLCRGLVPLAGRLAWGSAPLADDVAGHRARLHYVGHQDGVKPGLTPRETLAFWAALRGV